MKGEIVNGYFNCNVHKRLLVQALLLLPKTALKAHLLQEPLNSKTVRAQVSQDDEPSFSRFPAVKAFDLTRRLPSSKSLHYSLSGYYRPLRSGVTENIWAPCKVRFVAKSPRVTEQCDVKTHSSEWSWSRIRDHYCFWQGMGSNTSAIKDQPSRVINANSSVEAKLLTMAFV
ncbi:hypothetical protein TNCV_3360251 [Trichonephila clavipes]|nr:hypothetical protein TNCV_3360251 [Trichonephila clavipes]